VCVFFWCILSSVVLFFYSTVFSVIHPLHVPEKRDASTDPSSFISRVLCLDYDYNIGDNYPNVSLITLQKTTAAIYNTRPWHPPLSSTAHASRPLPIPRHPICPHPPTASILCTTSSSAKNATPFAVTAASWSRLADTTAQTVSLKSPARAFAQRRTGECALLVPPSSSSASCMA
jgi:hypothetical protein